MNTDSLRCAVMEAGGGSAGEVTVGGSELAAQVNPAGLSITLSSVFYRQRR